MIVMFNLINVSGINAFVLHNDKNNLGKKAVRYKFLQNLAFDLIKPLMEKRMKFIQIPIEIRIKCSKLCKKDFPSESSFRVLTRENRPATPTASCVLCKTSLNKFKNARSACSKCDQPACPNHLYKICDNCIKN